MKSVNKIRLFLGICFLGLLMSSCTNTGTVNILIANSGTDDCHNVQVAVAMNDIKTHLSINEGDTLTLLNEANRKVSFAFTPNGDSIVFVIPVINRASQKNYTINSHDKRLIDNLFRFRTANIIVNVGNNR